MYSYGVTVTAAGTTYNFHVDNTAKVRELYQGSQQVTDFLVTEQTHEHTAVTYRTMSNEEVQDILWGKAVA
jgi:VCBS repeat-containing protein